MEDFMQGLMLAGYLAPASVEEINQREALHEHDKKQSTKPKPNLYFKRVVLAAEIVSQLHEEPSLGRVKFQKLVYLCEHTAGMELPERYSKQAAGPFDHKFMHSINEQLKKNKWFSAIIENKTGYNRTKYIPLENKDGYKVYYNGYFKNENEKIQYVIDLFRKLSTDETELAATVFACVKELQSKNEHVLEDTLVDLIYAWSPEKQKFSRKDILKSFAWLHEKGLISS